MSDVIVPIVADTDELSSGPAPVVTAGILPDIPNGPLGDGIELLEKDVNEERPVRKTRSGTSSSGSSMKPSLSSRLDNLKISTIRQHYYPEGGWGWVICACAFVINMLTSGLLLSYGILYKEVIKEFGEEYTEQAMWLGSLSVSLGLFLSPLIVAFCRRKSTRLTAVFGGLTAALGCLFTSFASQMHQVFLSYGFVMALGLSLARVTSSLMIGQYFKRRREKVEAIVTSGTGGGVIIFSYSFAKIIKILGWRLGLHAVTGLAVIPFFVGICYRSASLYHPQRRAILHLKNQRKKIKDKSGVSDKPPFFDWSPLKNGSILVSMLSAAICAFGLYSPFFHLIPLLTAVGLEEDLILLLQFHLGISYSVGSGIFGILLVKKNAECIIGKQYLCQTAMVIMGLGLMSVSAAQGYYGFVLFAWMYGVPCGGLHYSLKMLVFEKIRAKSFSRAWAYVEWAQSIPVLIGIPVAGYISGSAGSRSGFYFSAAFSFAGAAALFLNRLTSRSPLGRRRGQGSCSTCTSQTPSCCCTQEFHLASQQGSSSGHPKCQKTISFSDTVDIADEDSPRRYPYTGKRFEGQNNFQEQPEPQDDVADHWDNDPNEFEENVDFDMVDDNVVICYDNGRPTNNKVVVVEDHKIINRYGCGHVEEEIDAGALQLAVPKRQMTIIEEVTSSV
ncbi:unnamed protein product [Larinioides sclopetarius]|uniref:Monocarboxylate transporter n=2 Tax=Larinioides sclopetarius TaxID=280406 RepID=A0AAV1ZXJ3_9ARAC